MAFANGLIKIADGGGETGNRIVPQWRVKLQGFYPNTMKSNNCTWTIQLQVHPGPVGWILAQEVMSSADSSPSWICGSVDHSTFIEYSNTKGSLVSWINNEPQRNKMHQADHCSIPFEAGATSPYHFFSTFPPNQVSSYNVGCCIINAGADLNSLSAIYFIFPCHFWSLVETPCCVRRSCARFSWPQIKGSISWILICLMKPWELRFTFVWTEDIRHK